MSYNNIIKKKALGVIVLGHRSVTLSAATETDHWTRPSFAADKLKEPMVASVTSSPGVVPSWTHELCAREANHESDGDRRTHITAVASNESATKVQSIHLPLPKKK